MISIKREDAWRSPRNVAKLDGQFGKSGLPRRWGIGGGKATVFVSGAARTNFCQAAEIDGGWLEGYPAAEGFARTLVHCIDVPDGTVIEEVNVWGTKQIKEMLNPF
jgi:hypothetical protein